jgi:hypothetical protein
VDKGIECAPPPGDGSLTSCANLPTLSRARRTAGAEAAFRLRKIAEEPAVPWHPGVARVLAHGLL